MQPLLSKQRVGLPVMAEIYVMDGFEFRIEGDIGFVRTEGVLGAKTVVDPMGVMRTMMRKRGPVRGLVVDVRSARYTYSPTEQSERARLLGRVQSELVIATVSKPEHDEMLTAILDVHEGRGGLNAMFRSTELARLWVRSVLDDRAQGLGERAIA
jgi:hypothetical protein